MAESIWTSVGIAVWSPDDCRKPMFGGRARRLAATLTHHMLDSPTLQFVAGRGLRLRDGGVTRGREAFVPTRIDMPPPFGSWLREQRDRSGLSQADIAALLDVSVQSVIGWEKERRYPRRDAEEQYRRQIAAAADDAVRTEIALLTALDAVLDDRTRGILARRFRLGGGESFIDTHADGDNRNTSLR